MKQYRDRRTERFANGEFVRELAPVKLQIEKRLEILEAAISVRDLAALPSNRLHALTGDRKGQYSIRANDRWRICFEWPEGANAPYNIEIVDYH